MDSGAENYRRFLNGDDDGFTEIIKEYKDGLTLYINRYVCNIFTAEELMEETFYILITKKPKFSNKSSFKAFLYSLGRNTAVNSLRRNSKLSDYMPEMCTDIAAEEYAVERDYIRNQDKIRVYDAMKKIKKEYSQVLYLTFFEDFSNEQAAKAMKKNKRQIENLLYRAKKALKSELEKEGFDYEIL